MHPAADLDDPTVGVQGVVDRVRVGLQVAAEVLQELRWAVAGLLRGVLESHQRMQIVPHDRPEVARPLETLLSVADFHAGRIQVQHFRGEPLRRHTKAFARYALELLRRMTIQDVALHLGVGWDMIKEIQKRDLLSSLRQAQAQAPATDRHRRDLHRQGAPLPDGRPGPGERGGGVRRRWQGGRRLEAVLEAAAAQRGQDQGGGHGHVGGLPGAVATNLPKAKIVFDHFHVIKLFNDKLSDLRRELHREATDVLHKKVLKGTRWLLLKNPENLDATKDEKQRLEEALRPEPAAGDGLLPEGGPAAVLGAVRQDDRRPRSSTTGSGGRGARGSACCNRSPRRWRYHRSGLLAYYD